MILNNSLAAFKSEFSSREGVHFNNAGLAPVSKRVHQAILTLAQSSLEKGALNDAHLLDLIIKTRAVLARFIDAKGSEVAFTPNCAFGLSQVALGFPLTNQDQVVMLDQEYSSNAYPWMEACKRSGAELTVVPSVDYQFPTEAFINAIRKGVKIVSVSSVQFQTGALAPLDLIGAKCKEVGAFLVVDAIQHLGQLPFSFSSLPVHAVVGASHKWLCGGTGQGFMAIKPELASMLLPTVVGGGTFGCFGTTANLNDSLDLRSEVLARKFEPGGFAFSSLAGLSAALGLFQEVSVGALTHEIQRLSGLLRAELLNLGFILGHQLDQPGGITSFKANDQLAEKILDKCRKNDVAIAKRGPFIRLSLHAFNNESEINQFIEILRSLERT